MEFLKKKKIKEQDVRELATEIFEYNIYSSKGVKEVLNQIDNHNNNYYQQRELGVNPGNGYNFYFSNKQNFII